MASVTRRRWPWVLLLVLAMLAALVAWFPARWAWAWLGPRHPQVQVGTLDGSIWHGHAGDVTVAGLALDRVDWQLARSALFGRVQLFVRAQGTWGTATGALHRQEDGSFEGDDLRFNLSAAALPPSLLGDGMQLQGMIEGTLDHWQLRNGWPVALRGRLVWHDAQLHAGASSLELGTWQADVADLAGTALKATLRDVDDAPVALAGTIDATPLGWRLDATLTPRTRSSGAHRLLRRLGAPDGHGGFRVRRQGGLMAPSAAP